MMMKEEEDVDTTTIPSRINSRAGSNFVSHSNVGLKPVPSQQNLETTQMMSRQPEATTSRSNNGPPK